MGKTSFLILFAAFIWLTPADISAQKEVTGIPSVVVLKSLLLPGWGEYEMGRPVRSRVFLLNEGFLWVSALTSFQTARRLETRYQAFAAEHAGVQPTSKDKQFWIDIGNYDSVEEFNAEHLRWRDMEALYPRSTTWHWEWDSAPNRRKFERIRIRSDRWAQAGLFIVGGIVVNHLVSAIDALYLSRLPAAPAVTVAPQFSPVGRGMAWEVALYF
jgi:hypothetical protein